MTNPPTPPDPITAASDAPATPPRRAGLSNTRFILALIIAVASDAASIAAQIALPVQWIIDGVTALLLFAILGKRWELLPGLVAEAIPGVATFPTWVLVVIAVRVAQRRPPIEPDRRENVRIIDNSPAP